MRKRTRPRISHDQRCTCARPRYSGRSYLGWKMCSICSGFMVADPVVQASLDAEERQAEELERRASG